MGEIKMEDATSSSPIKKVIDFGIDPGDYGKSDSLRYLILSQVSEEKYEKSIEDLRAFYRKESEYPTFKIKIERFVNHSIDLIFAIKAKKTFPGVKQLTRAKQQELRDRFKEHFKELVYMLKKIEKIERDLSIEDARSTIYVIRALWVSFMALMTTWFIMETFQGLAMTSFVVIADTAEKIMDFIISKIGL